MLIQIAMLAWLFLGEPLSWRMVLGMILAALGTLLVQIRRQRHTPRMGGRDAQEGQ